MGRKTLKLPGSKQINYQSSKLQAQGLDLKKKNLSSTWFFNQFFWLGNLKYLCGALLTSFSGKKKLQKNWGGLLLHIGSVSTNSTLGWILDIPKPKKAPKKTPNAYSCAMVDTAPNLFNGIKDPTLNKKKRNKQTKNGRFVAKIPTRKSTPDTKGVDHRIYWTSPQSVKRLQKFNT